MPAKNEKISFETAIKRIEEIVIALEKGDMSLDASLKAFEEGTLLVRKCNQTLDVAEQKLRLLLANAQGPEQTDFVKGE